MYMIIGTFRGSRGITALKLYDTVSRKMGIYPKDAVIERVKSGAVQVAGIALRPAAGDRYGIEREEYKITRDIYNVFKLDIVDEYGNPINGTNILVPIAVKGFGENSKVKFVDSRGTVTIKNYLEVVDLIHCKRVTGIKKNGNAIYTHAMCKQLGEDLGVGHIQKA